MRLRRNGGAGWRHLALVVGLGAVVVSACGNPDVVAVGEDPVSTTEPGELTLGTLPDAIEGLIAGGSTVPGNPPAASTTVASPTTSGVAAPPPVDQANAATQARPVPAATPTETPVAPVALPPWATSTRTTAEGFVTTDVGCSWTTSAAGLDAFFAERIGPLLGADYQHVYPLGGDRYLWLLQDSFVDHSGGAVKLNQASFIHNSALIQTGNCFQLLHRGTTQRPASFEDGAGERPLERWFWPLGGELDGGRLQVFWAEMHKDPYDPSPPDGLGWHPARTWLATYDARTMARLSFEPAPNDDVRPLYGFAVSSDTAYSYLFGNTFEQNMVREDGFHSGPHSATKMWLARVPRGQLGASPEYWSSSGWSGDRGSAEAFLQRHWAENPMQPRFIDGQWVAVAKVDGYWGEELTVDVAADPWGPWSTVEYRRISPRNGDGAMNTYHAHLTPWREPGGSWVVTVSNNARNMVRDAIPNPWRYRIAALRIAWAPVPPPLPPPPPPEPTTTIPPTTVAPTTTAPPTTVVPPTTAAPTTSTTAAPTTTAPTVPTTTSPPSSTTAVPSTSTTAAPG